MPDAGNELPQINSLSYATPTPRKRFSSAAVIAACIATIGVPLVMHLAEIVWDHLFPSPWQSLTLFRIFWSGPAVIALLFSIGVGEHLAQRKMRGELLVVVAIIFDLLRFLASFASPV